MQIIVNSACGPDENTGVGISGKGKYASEMFINQKSMGIQLRNNYLEGSQT